MSFFDAILMLFLAGSFAVTVQYIYDKALYGRSIVLQKYESEDQRFELSLKALVFRALGTSLLGLLILILFYFVILSMSLRISFGGLDLVWILGFLILLWFIGPMSKLTDPFEKTVPEKLQALFSTVYGFFNRNKSSRR